MGDYSVTVSDQNICWSNLTHGMNETTVFLTEGMTNNNYTNGIPPQNYKYIEGRLIIVAGKLFSYKSREHM